MLTFTKARLLAETWAQCVCGDGIELVQDATIAKPYGWIFFYQSSAYLQNPEDFSLALAGNAPVIIDRDSGEIILLGTALPTAEYLKRFEDKLPPARMHVKIEQPVWL